MVVASTTLIGVQNGAGAKGEGVGGARVPPVW